MIQWGNSLVAAGFSHIFGGPRGNTRIRRGWGLGGVVYSVRQLCVVDCKSSRGSSPSLGEYPGHGDMGLV
jgi:hypothetical protein